ncbi:hypothetical protein [Cohnella hashimotonis]|uniref:DUF4179 domain-containing protein n=1 Tax=Cohnella hashimotonis TaxID=2826895 RepID=A0ABT6TRK5_9BACL|nr:hypothetical protein [Cohnella hashimotonis]MDI4649364.1 hypothetical protein [Cohnella hashimotonis]
MNEDRRPSWYEQLKVDASRTEGFTETHMSAIEQMALSGKMDKKHGRSHLNRRRLYAATIVGVSVAMVVGAVLLSHRGDDLVRTLSPVTFTSTLTAVAPVPNVAPRPIRIQRLSGLLSAQLPFKLQDVVGIRLEDNQHRLQPFEVPKDRLNVILQNLNTLDIAAASISPEPEISWVSNAYTMTIDTAEGAFVMAYDPSSNTYGTPDTLLLADDQVWMLMQRYINPGGEWAAYDRLSAQASTEQAIVQEDRITDRIYERSRFNIDGLDYLGWAQKFLALSSGTLFYDGALGTKGFIQSLSPQSLTLTGYQYAYPSIIKLSASIVFTTDDQAYATPDEIKVGLTQNEVIAKLGLPNARTETAWRYRVDDGLGFQLLFEDGKVRFISLIKPD